MPIWKWFVAAHSRIESAEKSRGARLFASLMIIQFCLVLISLIALNQFYINKTGHSIWSRSDAVIVLVGMAVIGLSYIFLRSGLFYTGVILYILNTAAVALIAPFVPLPDAEMGLLASAIIPVLLTAMIFSYRWVAATLAAVLIIGISRLLGSSISVQDTGLGFSLMIVVAITGALVVILKYHLSTIEAESSSEIRKVAIRYRNLFETIPDGIFIADQNGYFVDVNRSACEQLGFSQHELIGKPVSEISGRSNVNIDEIISGIRENGKLSYKTSHIRKDGNTYPVELSISLIEHQGEVRIIGVARDISQHEAEISFRESLFKHAAEGLCVCHQIEEFPFMMFTFWNDKMTEITGYTMEEINKLGWYQTLYPDPVLRQRAVSRIAAMRDGDNLISEEWVITSKDDQSHTVEISTSIIELNDSNVHVLALIHDVTAKKTIEEALTNSESKFRTLLNSVMEGIGLVDRNEIITYANPAFAKILDFDDDEAIIGRSLLEFIAPESREIMFEETAKRKQGVCSQYELTVITDKGNTKYLYCSLTPRYGDDGSYDGALGAVLDITDRKIAEKTQLDTKQKLERAERMESLGILAGGVAHDLNNMLSPIVGYAGLILRELPENSKISSKIGKMAKAAEDASTVIQDLLTLARRGKYEMRPLDLNKVINWYLESAAFDRLKELNPGISLAKNLTPSPAIIKGSAPHLEKVIMNLVTNAFEAMKPGGSVTITTERIDINELYSGFQNIEAGEYIIVRFKDTGEGIASEDIEKIFEPYFSKKKMGHSGSGLGLSVVYGIIKDHKAYYDILSESGQGTEFILYFPAEKDGQLEETKHIRLLGGSETVLVVDDSEDQRELACEIISSLGYAVLAADNGHRAIDIISWQPVDIVVLDMIMEPNFDGLDTYRAIQKIKPGLKAIVVSGYSATSRVIEMQALGAGSYVRKPYTIETLANAIRDELNRKTATVNSP